MKRYHDTQHKHNSEMNS